MESSQINLFDPHADFFSSEKSNPVSDEIPRGSARCLQAEVAAEQAAAVTLALIAAERRVSVA